MAQIPFQNFAFTDPVAAQNAAQMAQILTLAQAEKDRNMAQFAQEIQRQSTARQNAAQQRAMTQSQMAAQASEGERNRAARATETDKLLASQERVANLNLKGRTGVMGEDDAFNSLAALIETEDPPTDSEFEQLSSAISEVRRRPLRIALEQRRRALMALADEAKASADNWNRLFDAVKVGEDQKFNQLVELFNKDKQANALLRKDPRFAFRLIPKYSGPRIDRGVGGVGMIPSPVTVDGVGAVIPTAPMKITPIEELLRRTTPNRSRLLSVEPMPAPGNVPNPAAFAVPQY